MLKISISGVRGIVGESLTPEVILEFSKAFGTYLKGKTVVLGADTRPSNEEIKDIVFDGLTSCGCNVIDLGITTTPTVGILTRHLKAAGGMVLTASHNPNPWNGLKFIAGDGIFLAPKEFNKLVKIYEKKKFPQKKPKGKITAFAEANDVHINKVLAAANTEKIKAGKFRVVIDSCNGAGSIITPVLLKKLGCTVTEINTNIKKPFPHGPEPTPQNLAGLSYAVIKNKADIGFAQDPDADRLSIVTNKGTAVSEEYTLAIAADCVLSRTKGGKVVANLSTSSLIDYVAKKHHAKILRTKIGEVYVASKIKKEKAPIGGEGNGGVIFPQIGLNRDSLAGIALVLSCLSETGKTIEQIIAEFPKYFLSKAKVKCAGAEEAKKILKKAEIFYKKEKIDRTEGLKVYLKEGWVHLRPSNTEPILRIFCEAGTKKAAERLAKEAQSFLKD